MTVQEYRRKYVRLGGWSVSQSEERLDGAVGQRSALYFESALTSASENESPRIFARARNSWNSFGSLTIASMYGTTHSDFRRSPTALVNAHQSRLVTRTFRGIEVSGSSSATAAEVIGPDSHAATVVMPSSLHHSSGFVVHNLGRSATVDLASDNTRAHQAWTASVGSCDNRTVARKVAPMTVPALMPIHINPAPAVRWPVELPLAAFDPRVLVACDLDENLLGECGICPEDDISPAVWRITYSYAVGGQRYITDVCGAMDADVVLRELLAIGKNVNRRAAIDVVLHLPGDWALTEVAA